MPHPSDPHLCHILHLGEVLGRVAHFLSDLRIDPVQQPSKDRFPGIPGYLKNHCCDEEAHEGISPWVRARKRYQGQKKVPGYISDG